MTALQGAVIAGTVINGGTRTAPYVVSAVDGEGVDVFEAPADAISADTAEQIAECMRLVVTDGIGKSAAVDGVDVGGKTGTAETAEGADDGWFIGFASADGKTIAFAVMIEASDSSDAAAVASSIIESTFKN